MFNGILPRVKDEFKKLEAEGEALKPGITPPVLLYAGVALLIVLSLAAYIWWRGHRTPVPPAGKPVTPPPAVDVAKVMGPVLKVPVKIVPKAAVKKALPQMTEDVAEDDAAGEEEGGPSKKVVDTREIPAAPDGGKTVSKIDIKTGEVTTQFQKNPEPWFAFRADNALGAGVQLSTAGGSVPVYYRRTVAQVKSIYLVGEAGGRIPASIGIGADRAEAHVGAFVEGRW